MKLDTAIALIVGKLHEEGDLLNEECVEALTKIGIDSVVEAIADDYPDGDWSFRLSALPLPVNRARVGVS